MRKRYIQHPDTHELIEADQYVKPAPAYYVMPDIQPYKSVITGEIIGSRSKHRAHLKQHNCIEVGNEKMTPKRMPDVGGRREAIIDAYKKLGGRF